jgi:hypothetical protein
MSDRQLDDQPEPSPVVLFCGTRYEPCPRCGYGLYRVAADVCPSCNLPLELRLKAAADPCMSWYVAVIGVAMATGVDVLALGFAISPVVRGWSEMLWAAIVGFGILGGVCAQALWWLFAEYESWIDLSPSERTFATVGTYALTLVVHAVGVAAIAALE